ncbi:MAG TPA: hypothetical protein VJ949_10485 [Cryomorphaceae bacterium]|nr:hypothetical protein [Cryomorphaceae bacterium]
MDTKKLDTGLTILAFIIGIIGLFLGIRIMVGYEDVIGTSIWLVFGLMILAGGAAIIFGLVQLLTNLKRNMSLLIGIIGFVVLAFICYSIASDDVSRYSEDITTTASQVSGAGLMLMYILVIGAVVMAIIGEVVRIFK